MIYSWCAFVYTGLTSGLFFNAWHRFKTTVCRGEGISQLGAVAASAEAEAFTWLSRKYGCYIEFTAVYVVRWMRFSVTLKKLNCTLLFKMQMWRKHGQWRSPTNIEKHISITFFFFYHIGFQTGWCCAHWTLATKSGFQMKSLATKFSV